MSRGFRQFLTWGVIPYLLVMVVSLALFFSGHVPEAMFTSTLGTITVATLGLFYIVFVDSRKRWPGVPAGERAARVMTFYRGP